MYLLQHRDQNPPHEQIPKVRNTHHKTCKDLLLLNEIRHSIMIIRKKFTALPDKHHLHPILLLRGSCLFCLTSFQVGSVAIGGDTPARMIVWVGHKVGRHNVLHKLEASLLGRGGRKGRNRLHVLLGRGGINPLHLLGRLLSC